MSETRVVHLRKEHYDILIDRTTIFGNKYHIGKDSTRAQVIHKHLLWLIEKLETDLEFKEALLNLRGKTLGCWCKPLDCHGDNYALYLDKGIEYLYEKRDMYKEEEI